MSGMNRAMSGGLAGTVGGVAMASMRMTVAERLPLQMHPGELVPKKAVEWAEERAGHPEALRESAETGVGMAGHLAFSALTGTLYGLSRPRTRTVPAPLSGALFGMAVWAASFEGWMPALGIMERTTSKPVPKWAAPLMGHLIFGVTTALVFERLERRGQRRQL